MTNKQICSGEDIKPIQQMISSCSGAIITSLFVTPLDVVKIRLQAQVKPFRSGQCFLYCNGLMDHLCTCLNSSRPRPWYQNSKHFKGTLSKRCTCTKWHLRQCGWYIIVNESFTIPNLKKKHYTLYGTMDGFIKIARYEGLSKLWSGLPPTLLMAIPTTVIYFTCYDQLKFHLGFISGDPSKSHLPIIAGVLARFGAVTCTCPLELIRTKMQSERLTYVQLSKAIKFSLKSDGISTFIKGLKPMLLRDIPFSAVYWYGYESLKSKQMNLALCQEATFQQSFIAGAISGTVAAVLTLPFDVIKTHQQIALGQASSPSLTIMQQIKKLYITGGISSLFTGIIPRVVKVAPACAIMISTYEYGKQFFAQYNKSLILNEKEDTIF